LFTPIPKGSRRITHPITTDEESRMPKLKNTNPLGAVDLPLIGRSLEPGEEFEVPDEQALALLEQVGNFELVSDDLDSLTIPELEKYAADRDIDLTGLTKKPAIISAIKKG
jgi:hypothetical protein